MLKQLEFSLLGVILSTEKDEYSIVESISLNYKRLLIENLHDGAVTLETYYKNSKNFLIKLDISYNEKKALREAMVNIDREIKMKKKKKKDPKKRNKCDERRRWCEKKNLQMMLRQNHKRRKRWRSVWRRHLRMHQKIYRRRIHRCGFFWIHLENFSTMSLTRQHDCRGGKWSTICSIKFVNFWQNKK